MKSKSNSRASSIIALTIVASAFFLQAGSKNVSHHQKSNTGAKLYMASCEPCHLTGGNMIDPEKKIVNSQKLATEKIFRQFLATQHAQMPPWKTIVRNDSELRALYAYVRELK
ncbi:hypothetical protein BH10CYA1_BH10CYA1_49860 [soil metagenome]